MKISKIVFLGAMLTTTLISCRKEGGVKNNMAGTWEGRFGFGNEIPTYFEKWELEKNGDLTAYDPFGDVYATGSWETEGDDSFEAEYSPVGANYSYTFSGFYDEGEIVGTWGESPSAIDGGTFEMYKQ